MKIKLFLTISLLFLIGSGSVVFANPFPELPPAEIQQAADNHAETTRHTGQAVLFSVPASGESGFNFRDRLPNSNSEEHSKEDDVHTSLNSSALQNFGFYYFVFSGFIDCSQSIKILLFPFHSHL